MDGVRVGAVTNVELGTVDLNDLGPLALKRRVRQGLRKPGGRPRTRRTKRSEAVVDDEVVVSNEFKAELLLLVLAAEDRLDARLGQHLFVVSRKSD